MRVYNPSQCVYWDYDVLVLSLFVSKASGALTMPVHSDDCSSQTITNMFPAHLPSHLPPWLMERNDLVHQPCLRSHFYCRSFKYLSKPGLLVFFFENLTETSPLTKSPEGIQRTNIISYPSLDRYRWAQTQTQHFLDVTMETKVPLSTTNKSQTVKIAWFIYLCLLANIDMSELSKLGWLSWAWSGPLLKGIMVLWLWSATCSF